MRTIASILGATILLGSLVGCADMSKKSQAEELEAELADLPGVASVDLDYTKPVPLDSGKLALKVTMSRDADRDQITEVVQTAYDAFRGTHHGEEADLSVAAGKTTVALRAFEPEATVDAVGQATTTGLDAAPDDGWVAIDLMTQEVDKGDHVSGTYLVGMPDGTTAADVPAELEALAADHDQDPLFGWGAAAADGASLAYDSGFPPQALLTTWSAAQDAELPLAVRAFADGSLFAEGTVPAGLDATTRGGQRDLDRIVHPQLRALGDGQWVYDLYDADGDYLASLDRYICESTSEGRYDDRLEAWVKQTHGPCTSE